MEIADHISALHHHGLAMADAVEVETPDAEIVTCPGWVMRDLVRHTGDVHRWAADIVSNRRTRSPGFSFEENGGPPPSDDRLGSWLRQGLTELVQVLESAPPDLECWTFMAAPSPLAFWARRQGHETAIHRVDAELANGVAVVFEPELAADGIDELLVASLTRKGRGPRADPSRSLLAESSDTDHTWLSTIAAAAYTTERVSGSADCTIRGTASQLYQFLWNRAERSTVSVEGDGRVLDIWREEAKI